LRSGKNETIDSRMHEKIDTSVGEVERGENVGSASTGAADVIDQRRKTEEKKKKKKKLPKVGKYNCNNNNNNNINNINNNAARGFSETAETRTPAREFVHTYININIYVRT
jgi:hypothetical protein